MPEWYNLSNMTQSQGLMGLAQNSDRLLEGYFFGWSVLLMVGVVMFAVLKGKNVNNSGAFAVTSWLLLIISWFLRAMSLINNTTLWTMVLLAIAGVFGLFMSNN